MAMVLKLIYRFKVICIKIPADFSKESNSLILKMQGTHSTQNNLERNNNARGLIHLNFKTYCQAIIINTV